MGRGGIEDPCSHVTQRGREGDTFLCRRHLVDAWSGGGEAGGVFLKFLLFCRSVHLTERKKSEEQMQMCGRYESIGRAF